MADTDYDFVVAEVAKDLKLDEQELRAQFSTYLATAPRSDSLEPATIAACYAVYRLTKSRWAFRVTSKSREQWRRVALGKGATPILRQNPELADE